jgi:hypothetical protein
MFPGVSILLYACFQVYLYCCMCVSRCLYTATPSVPGVSILPYVSAYYYICVLVELMAETLARVPGVSILLYLCPHTTVYVSAYYCICVRILLHVSAYYCICVRILLYLCPHTTVYVFAYCYVCVLIVLYVCVRIGCRRRRSVCGGFGNKRGDVSAECCDVCVCLALSLSRSRSRALSLSLSRALSLSDVSAA